MEIERIKPLLLSKTRKIDTLFHCELERFCFYKEPSRQTHRSSPKRKATSPPLLEKPATAQGRREAPERERESTEMIILSIRLSTVKILPKTVVQTKKKRKRRYAFFKNWYV
jgi:hypothetical protein